MATRTALLAIALMTITAGRVFSQIGDLPNRLSIGLKKDQQQEVEEKVSAKLVANVAAVQPGKPFELGILFEVPKGYYGYYKHAGSIGLPTQIDLQAPKDFEIGTLQWPGPDVKHQKIGEQEIANYIYKQDVVVFATVTPPADVQPETKVNFTAKLKYQYCKEDGSCFMETPQLTLDMPVAWGNAQVEPSEQADEFRASARNLPVSGDQSKYAAITPRLNLSKLYPGAKAELQLVVDVLAGHHLQMNQPPIKGLISTDLITEFPKVIKQLAVPVYPEPAAPLHPIEGFEAAKEYRGQFVITVPIEARESLTGDSITLQGIFRYQACEDSGTCFPAVYASFSLDVPVTQDPSEAKVVAAVTPPPSGTSPTGESSGGLSSLGYVDKDSGQSTGMYLLYAFIGGLILNIMPCVLPVVAIKLLGFVQQAGENRGRILALNVSYSMGVITVFLILASLAVSAGITWGGLFQSEYFNLIMAGLVFAMGLSLLGVFEIPVPGFVGSAAGGAHREGLFGAYATGIFATLLATPCSGPYLGVTLGWSVRQDPSVTFATWGLMGLGMSSPYLLVGMFPGFIRFLPKPGNWMVRFKELAGLVLMGTVVFIITFLNDTHTIPVLVMLVGLSIGLYMIGNLYDINSHIKHKTTVWISALVVTVGTCVFAFTYMKDMAEFHKARQVAKQRDLLIEEIDTLLAGKLDRPLGVMLAEAIVPDVENAAEMKWQPFSTKKLEELLAQKKSVMIDFTAVWCPNCHVNEAVAINTKETVELVEKLGIVPLYADFSERSPEIKEVLEKFGSISIPLTVIIPGDRPEESILLRDLFTQSMLLEALGQVAPAEKSPEAVSQAPAQPPR